MPQYARTPDLLERIAALEDRLAALEHHRPVERDELPFYPTHYQTVTYCDSTSWTTQWEVIFTPRTGSLSLGLVAIGDVVGTTNTGGQWQVLLDDAVVMSGSVPATFSYQHPAAVLDLAPYRTAAEVKVEVQTRRTTGANTGGKFGGGGSIGIAPRYARMI